MRAFLSRWLGFEEGCDASHPTVTVYTRDGCSCCHKAIDVLKESGAGIGSRSRRSTWTPTRTLSRHTV